jgi:protein-L-isoaspartate(D-aspartate) O-methyltransferase
MKSRIGSISIVLSVVFLLLRSGSAADEIKTGPDTPADRGKREALVQKYIVGAGITDRLVIDAMKEVPRHLFMPESVRKAAYEDRPVPIGEGQTISQPYIVALMTECLAPKKTDRVLEIGTGSGYQAAVIASIAKEVYSIEIKKILHERSRVVLASLGYDNVVSRCADGYFGWKEKAPFDRIMITAAVNHVPRPLFEQLATGGTMVLPLGNPWSYQNLVRITKKSADDYTIEEICGVLFVPITGQAEDRKDR